VEIDRWTDFPLALGHPALETVHGQPAPVVTDRSGTIIVGAVTGEVRPLPGNGPVSALLALPSPAGRCLVAAAVRSRLLVWDVASGELIKERTLPYATPSPHCASSPYPKIASRWPSPRPMRSHSGIRSDAMSRIDTPYTAVMTSLPQPSGAWLLAVGNGTGMRLWDPLTGRLVHCLLIAAPVTNIVHHRWRHAACAHRRVGRTCHPGLAAEGRAVAGTAIAH
jgi:hypothetical protein